MGSPALAGEPFLFLGLGPPLVVFRKDVILKVLWGVHG